MAYTNFQRQEILLKIRFDQENFQKQEYVVKVRKYFVAKCHLTCKIQKLIDPLHIFSCPLILAYLTLVHQLDNNFIKCKMKKLKISILSYLYKHQQIKVPNFIQNTKKGQRERRHYSPVSKLQKKPSHGDFKVNIHFQVQVKHFIVQLKVIQTASYEEDPVPLQKIKCNYANL